MFILYIGDKHFSGWSMRGRIAVMEKQVGVEERLIELDWPTQETPEGVLVVGDGKDEREAQAGCACEVAELVALDREGLLRGSSAAVLPRVPVLVDTQSRRVASDVVAIAELLDEVQPDSGVRLMGSTPAMTSQVRSVAAWAYHDLHDLVYGASYAKSLRDRDQGPMDPRAAEQAGWVCDTLEGLLSASGGPFAFGEFTLVDVMVSTYFQQMRGWGYKIAIPTVAQYAQRLLARPSVSSHLEEARQPYERIAVAEPGSPAWILAHYRYNRTHRLLHDWQEDRCFRVANDTAAAIVTAAMQGRPRDAIVARVADAFGVPGEQVADDVDVLMATLSPTSMTAGV